MQRGDDREDGRQRGAGNQRESSCDDETIPRRSIRLHMLPCRARVERQLVAVPAAAAVAPRFPVFTRAGFVHIE